MAIIKHGLTLAIAVAAAVAAAVFADALWREKIDANRQQYERRLLLETLSGVGYARIIAAPPQMTPLVLPSSTVVALWRAASGEHTAAIAARIVTRGYGGDIVFIAAFDNNGRRLQSRIVRHSETPGIADFLTDANGGERAINGVSGATITSNALAAAARDIADWIKTHPHVLAKIH